MQILYLMSDLLFANGRFGIGMAANGRGLAKWPHGVAQVILAAPF